MRLIEYKASIATCTVICYLREATGVPGYLDFVTASGGAAFSILDVYVVVLYSQS